ncbi:hypothetical protein GE118_03940 [Mycoplasma sp. NEAQ87857]|uniref:DNA-directed RNA polymerase subunit delta n=1 Tax=Mycoplasma sp. NEAQ87857 TaxID=2683967 RepID=UPI0013172478|nr:hypothetical protein [Mycoplasma sp. NEAQ87857]QGZ97927.1 hypothetical protein GE118_03940 [Mycoplasma sp. NEAQ87857]
MKTRTMLEIAIDAISEDTKKQFTFDELFHIIEDELKDDWTEKFVNDSTPYEKIQTKKMGELYRLLTVDKRFHRNFDGTWQSKTIEVYVK